MVLLVHCRSAAMNISARPCRPFLLDLIARAEADPDSDEAHFLGQLRAAISGLEGLASPFQSRPRSPRPDLRAISPGE
jgi:hypothetical protein